jgi:hypothetical protein
LYSSPNIFREIKSKSAKQVSPVIDMIQKFGAESEAKRLLMTPGRRDYNIVT